MLDCFAHFWSDVLDEILNGFLNERLEAGIRDCQSHSPLRRRSLVDACHEVAVTKNANPIFVSTCCPSVLRGRASLTRTRTGTAMCTTTSMGRVRRTTINLFDFIAGFAWLRGRGCMHW